MLDCEILVSCGGSFSFFPGMLKGKNFISPNIPGACVGNKLACKTCLSWNWKDTNAGNKLCTITKENSKLSYTEHNFELGDLITHNKFVSTCSDSYRMWNKIFIDYFF